MKTIAKTTVRLLAALALCAALSACGQPSGLGASEFPSYNPAAVTGHFVSPSIMDY